MKNAPLRLEVPKRIMNKKIIDRKIKTRMINPMKRLTFGQGNAKLTKRIATFSLPAGWACPSAFNCLSKANPETGKLTDGPNCLFRCYAATSEARLPAVRRSRWHNLNLLKECCTTAKMTELILASLPKEFDLIRIHVSGDFFSDAYFKAWLEVARQRPGIIFYGYTKSIRFWIDNQASIPANFRLVASMGGKEDSLAKMHNLVTAVVVYSPEEAEQKGIEIDHDDSHAINPVKSFALLIHGGQPKGNTASVAWEKIKRTVGGYSTKRQRNILTIKA
jgi:hypothetical protein